jgi:hypothetical protein
VKTIVIIFDRYCPIDEQEVLLISSVLLAGSCRTIGFPMSVEFREKINDEVQLYWKGTKTFELI